MEPNRLAYELKDLPWSRTTSYELINAGQLRAVKVGRKTLVLAEDLEECLRKLRSIPPKASPPVDEQGADKKTKAARSHMTEAARR